MLLLPYRCFDLFVRLVEFTGHNYEYMVRLIPRKYGVVERESALSLAIQCTSEQFRSGNEDEIRPYFRLSLIDVTSNRTFVLAVIRLYHADYHYFSSLRLRITLQDASLVQIR